jgi:hypothetical protein
VPSPAPSSSLQTVKQPLPPSFSEKGGEGWIRLWKHPAVGIALPLIIGLIHVALIAPLYRVGSFDDDSSYILTAQAMLSGQGLTGHLASGQVVVGLYPPGYSALLVPLVWLWPHSFVPLRLLSVVCYAAVFPLTWILLARRGVSQTIRVATLTAIALSPPFATFGSMVMAEGPFLVVLLLMLLALDRWITQDRAITWIGAGTIVAAAGVVWLKQAGIALVGGLVLWLLFKSWRKAVVMGAGVALSLAPVVIARAMAGIPLAGSRYSSELGGFYQGGLLGRLHHVLPSSTWHLFSTAVPATLVPYLEPLPLHGHWPDLWKVLSWHVSVLAAIGAVRWFRRYRDATAAMVGLYLIESVLWPFVNERRAILILPLLAAWYVLGAATLWDLVQRAVAGRLRTGATLTAGFLASALVVIPLIAQMPRDYLFPWGQSSSKFEGSRYVALLRQLGSPQDVVETDYQSSVALFTGHATNWSAFTVTEGDICYLPGAFKEMGVDHAGYLLIGDLNKPGVVDNGCLGAGAYSSDWAVRLLYTTRDNSSVFELIGPGTAHPDLTNLLETSRWSLTTNGSTSTAEWDFAAPSGVSQVSVGEAAASVAPTSSVQIDLRRPDGSWFQAAVASRALGDGQGSAPYLLRAFSQPLEATAMRVVVTGANSSGDAVMGDVAALGSAATTGGGS